MNRRAVVLATVCAVALAGCGTVDEDGVVGANTAVLDLTTTPTEDHGCAYTFAVGTTDGRVRLALYPTAVDEIPTPGTVPVDGEAWVGELVAGEDLFVQWCDDSPDSRGPAPVEEARWPVTGTLRWATDGTGDCDGPATATLVDGAVAVDDGTVPLPEIELRHESFGCLPG